MHIFAWLRVFFSISVTIDVLYLIYPFKFKNTLGNY